MMKTIITTVWSLLFVLPSFAGNCERIIPEKFEKHNTVELHGYFFHPDHCFSVVIPNNVIGRDNSEPQSHHGFGAILSIPPHAAYLYVGTEPAGMLDGEDGNQGTLEGQASLAIKWLVQSGAAIIDQQVKRTELGGLPAVRATITYSCPNTQLQFVQDNIYASQPDGPMHLLTLTSSMAAYGESRKVLDEMASTWKLEKGKCEEEFKKRLKGGF